MSFGSVQQSLSIFPTYTSISVVASERAFWAALVSSSWATAWVSNISISSLSRSTVCVSLSTRRSCKIIKHDFFRLRGKHCKVINKYCNVRYLLCKICKRHDYSSPRSEAVMESYWVDRSSLLTMMEFTDFSSEKIEQSWIKLLLKDRS